MTSSTQWNKNKINTNALLEAAENSKNHLSYCFILDRYGTDMEQIWNRYEKNNSNWLPFLLVIFLTS